MQADSNTMIIHPIGRVVKENGHTWLELEKRYQEGLEGLAQFDEVMVLYWFDRNDTEEKRSVLKVHPMGDRSNPLRGVFSTHAPMRPNLIAVTRCHIISVQDNVVEVDTIDAHPGTPILDLKSG